MFNTIAAIGTIALQAGIVVVIIGWITKARFVSTIARHTGIILASIFTAATLMSFIYQYGIGFEPCILCWYQRLAIMPIAVIAWTANLRTSKVLQNQILVLSVIGILIAALHVYIDFFPSNIDVCGASGPSCLIRYVYEFGYITIPVMSMTVLACSIVLTLLAKYYPEQPVVTPASI